MRCVRRFSPSRPCGSGCTRWLRWPWRFPGADGTWSSRDGSWRCWIRGTSPPPWSRALPWFGGWCYSFYPVQPFSVSAVEVSGLTSWLGMASVFFVAHCAAGYAVHRAVERPVMAWRTRRAAVRGQAAIPVTPTWERAAGAAFNPRSPRTTARAWPISPCRPGCGPRIPPGSRSSASHPVPAACPWWPFPARWR